MVTAKNTLYDKKYSHPCMWFFLRQNLKHITISDHCSNLSWHHDAAVHEASYLKTCPVQVGLEPLNTSVPDE